MRTTTRTPGPWTYQYSPYTSQDGKEIPAFEIHGEEKVCDTNEDRPVEEQEVNARLIAAAPELLEALKYAYQILGKIYDGEKADVGSALQPCSDAIARAGGGPQ